MINVLLLNNTENYHSGCKQVINYFRNNFLNDNLTIFDKKSKNLPNCSNYDLIILNGEGSIHDDSKKMIKYLEYMNDASRKSVITMVVNTVWCNNSKNTTELLKNIDYVSVRECLSKIEIQNTVDREVDVNLDLSYFVDVPYFKTEKTNILSGNKFLPKKEKSFFKSIGEEEYVDIFSENWDIIVNKLRHCNIFITGRHHEMYAACKAKCKFIIVEGNSHKNSGLLKTVNSKIPYLDNPTDDEIFNLLNNIENYSDDFDDMFRKMDEYHPPNFISLYRDLI